MKPDEFARTVVGSRDRLAKDRLNDFYNLLQLSKLQVDRIRVYALEKEVRGLEYEMGPEDRDKLRRIREGDQLQKEMGVYRHPVSQLESLMKYAAIILKRYQVRDSLDFENHARELYQNAKYFYSNNPKKVAQFDKVLMKSEQLIYKWEKMLGRVPKEIEKLYREESRQTGSPMTHKAVAMLAIIGFFSIFLYSTSPTATGQPFALSEFNLYLTAIFTFITMVALYLIYKM
jgi:hypothetical protein